MTNLIILGNGFDMAHGLKTSYSNFMEHIINNKFKDRGLYSDLFDFHKALPFHYKSYNDIKNDSRVNDIKFVFATKNLLFRRLTNKLFDLNWCDIEREYFTELSNIGKDARYKTAGELNYDFTIIKKYLSEYLKLEQLNFGKIWVYEHYFKKMCFENTMVLNFNYTNTVFNYVKGYDSELVQIHGEIENEENPIIFGYAADNNESRNLLQYEDKEFMRNIKKHNYKRTKEENRLIRFLEDQDDIEVTIIGHSCGLSDKLILNQIFNNKNVSALRMFYHKNYENYFETQVNIDRIMNNDSNFRKLINFQESLLIPQHTHAKELKPFVEKFNLVFENKRKNQRKNQIELK